MFQNMLIITILLFQFSSVMAVANSTRIEGNYLCKGYDPYTNNHYQGKGIIKKTNDTYSLTWDFGKDMVYKGTGILNKTGQDLAVIFMNPSNKKETGVLVYHLEKDGSLRDNWTFFGKTEVGKGVCRKIVKENEETR